MPAPVCVEMKGCTVTRLKLAARSSTGGGGFPFPQISLFPFFYEKKMQLCLKNQSDNNVVSVLMFSRQHR